MFSKSVCVVAKLRNIALDKQNFKFLSGSVNGDLINRGLLSAQLKLAQKFSMMEANNQIIMYHNIAVNNHTNKTNITYPIICDI